MQGRVVMSTSCAGKALVSVVTSWGIKTPPPPSPPPNPYSEEHIWENPWLRYLVVVDSLLQLSQLTSWSTRVHQTAGDQARYSPNCHGRAIPCHENILVFPKFTVQSLLSKLIWLEFGNSTYAELHQAVFPSNHCPNCDWAGFVSRSKVWVGTVQFLLQDVLLTEFIRCLLMWCIVLLPYLFFPLRGNSSQFNSQNLISK